MPHRNKSTVELAPTPVTVDANITHQQISNETQCCIPTGCSRGVVVLPTDLISKVICNNEQCTSSGTMHRACFTEWEGTILGYLKTCGRARSWSEKQRLQNLWTKRGYDLAYKACNCMCNRGHLRKDLNYEEKQPEPVKSKKKKKQAFRPILNIQQPSAVKVPEQRPRGNSISSTGSSPTSTGSPDSPLHTGVRRKSFFSDRSRHGSGGNGVFSRRADFSSFNALPRHKINSYHIKMEDDGNHGNDDTRCFILSNMAASKMSRTACVICQDSMLIFDKYPLVDGTFFLSPRQHYKTCIQVKFEGRTHYLSAVCMGCLEGWTCRLNCKSCNTKWNGNSLILGTMYSYDIFAAVPCCPERLKCTHCHQLVIRPDVRLNFFSNYSHPMTCPSCGMVDHHFVPHLSAYRRSS